MGIGYWLYEALEQNVDWMGDGVDTPQTVMTTRAPAVLINCILNQSIVKNDLISLDCISIIASHQVILFLTGFLIYSSKVALQCFISAYQLWLLVKAKGTAYFPFGEMSIFKETIKAGFKTQAR